MQVNDEAIVLSSSKYGENSGIVCVLTEKHGLYKGLVKGITGKDKRGIFQSGNIIEMTWRARLSEHLGNLSGGLVHAGAMLLMDEPLKLAALSSLCALFEATLQERDPAPVIYGDFKSFIKELGKNSRNWQKSYILLEVELLAQLGFGLDLSSCAATETTEDLIYVSPKSGRAVSRDAGKPYCNKLLRLPDFLLLNTREKISQEEIEDGINLCSFFFDKYFFAPHNIQQPQARARFVGMLRQKSPPHPNPLPPGRGD